MNDVLIERPNLSERRRSTPPGPPGPRPPVLLDFARRWQADMRSRLWPTSLLFGLVSLVLVLQNAPGRYAGDNRLEQYLSPARRLAKSLSIWDGAAGTGGVREDFWPGTTIPVALFRGLGFGIVGTQKLWHAVCLSVAALGAVQVMRLFRRTIGVEHLVCGAIVAYGPFSVVFLIPSNLYFQYALGPWFLVAFVSGVREARPWRWAAVFALATFLAGNVDAPGLVANLLPLVPAAAYLVWVERSTSVARVAGWLARALVLSVACAGAALAKTYFALDSLSLRLEQSEAATINASTSSWPETMRGLGNWLSYVVVNGGYVKPQNLALFRNPLLVAITFVPVLIAITTLTWSTWRPRVLFGAMAVQSMILMVGGFPAANPSRLGRMLLWAMENVRLLKGFRNTYKTGLGLTLGVGALAGMAVAEAADRFRQARRPARWPSVVALIVVAGLAFPFWSGNLYAPKQTFTDVPQYWSDAFRFLDRFPFGGRSMIVPATSRSGYRWGWVGDDIFDASLARAHPVATGVPLSNPLAANLLEEMTLRMQDPVYRPGVIGPLARRLGISEIVIRNDLDWRELGVARPALYEGLRNDPDLERVAAFGEVGQNVVAFGDDSAVARLERRLPPIEVFRVANPSPLVRVDADVPSIIVAGDGGAFAEMAGAGLLAGGSTMFYTGALDDDRIVEHLRRKGGLVITDTNRRRLRTLIGYEPDYSGTLAAEQDTFRPVSPLFPGVEGAESVAWFPDAGRIIGTTNRLGGETTERRPAMAFDGDPTTAWQLSQYEIALGTRLRVEFPSPRTVSSFTLQPVPGITGSPTVTDVALRFSSGDDVRARVDESGRITTRFSSRSTDFVEIELRGYDPFSPIVGIIDVDLGLDLREFVQVPDDLRRRAQANPALTAALVDQPMAYLFERVRRPTYRTRRGYGELGEFRPDEEQTVRRRFWTAGERRFRLDAIGHVRPVAPDELINALLDRPTTATPTDRLTDRMGAWAAMAIDGDPSTAWQAPADTHPALTIRGDVQVIRTVSVTSRPEFGFLPIENVDITVGSETRTAKFQVPQRCAADPSPAACAPVARASFGEGTASDRFIVRVGDVTPSFDLNANSVRIDEVEVNGQANARLDPAAPLSLDCIDIGLLTGDAPADATPTPVRVTGNVGGLLSGRDIGATGCDEAALSGGWHVLDDGSSWLDQVSLRTTDSPLVARPAPVGSPLEINERSAGRISVRTASATASSVILANSFDPSWGLSVNGGSYRAPEAADGVNRWDVAEGGSLDLSFRYRPDDTFGRAFVVSLGAVVISCWLALRRPRPVVTRVAALGLDYSGRSIRPGWSHNPVDGGVGGRPGDGVSTKAESPPGTPGGSSPASMRGLVVVATVGALVGTLLIGPLALVLAVAGAVSSWRSDRPGRLLGISALLMVVVAWLASTLQSRPQLTVLSLRYAVRRTIANEFGAVAGVCMLLSVLLAAWHSRAPYGPHRDRAAARWVRRAAASVQLTSVTRAVPPAALATAVADMIGRISGRVDLPAGYGDLVANLRRGSAYTLDVGFGPPALDAAPLAPALHAFLPAVERHLIWLMILAGALVVYQVSSSRGGRRAGLFALGVYALLPTTWNGTLAVVASGTATIGALAVADCRDLSPRRAFAAGTLIAVATLARPDAIVVAVVIGVWWFHERAERSAVVAGAAGLVLGMAPWANFVWSAGAAPRLSGTWSAMLADPLAVPIGGVRLHWGVAAVVLVFAGLAMARSRLTTSGFGAWFGLLASTLFLGLVALVGDVPRDPLSWGGPAVAVCAALLWTRRVSLRRVAAPG